LLFNNFKIKGNTEATATIIDSWLKNTPYSVIKSIIRPVGKAAKTGAEAKGAAKKSEWQRGRQQA